MNKTLSLNTQLSKLRSAVKMLKGILPLSISTSLTGYADTSRFCVLNDIVYSLRDIQYELRGLSGYKAKRSAQVNHYNIDDIMKLLREMSADHQSSPSEIYNDTLSQVLTELETVAYYVNNRDSQFESDTANNTPDIENSDLY